MNRYKIKEVDFIAAIKYLKTGNGEIDAPNWAIKNKKHLTIKKKKIFFKGLEIIPEEKVDMYLRNALYTRGENLTPFGRDSGYHSIKKKASNITRRRLMKFLRAQKTLGSTRPSLPKVKVSSGEKLKKLTLGTDLVFVRKNDLVKALPSLENEVEKFETYILTTVEKNSGLVQLAYLQNKSETASALEKQIKWFAKQFGVKPSDFQLRSDKGSEYPMKRLKKLVPDYKFVSSEVSTERKNRQIQQSLFRILKNRMADSVEEAVRKSQNMANDTYNKVHKKTPNECLKLKNSEIIKMYNSKRKTYKKGDTRLDFEVGQHVRIQADKKVRSGIGYKSYKG